MRSVCDGARDFGCVADGVGGTSCREGVDNCFGQGDSAEEDAQQRCQVLTRVSLCILLRGHSLKDLPRIPFLGMYRPGIHQAQPHIYRLDIRPRRCKVHLTRRTDESSLERQSKMSGWKKFGKSQVNVLW